MLLSIILWPFTVFSNIVSFLFHCTVFIVLLPFKVIQSILRSLLCKLQIISSWAEVKIRHIKTVKPFVLLFPIHQLEDSVDTDEVDTNEQPSTTAGHYHHGRAGKRISKRGAQSPARSHHKMKGEHDSMSDLPPVSSSSMNTLIQDLLEFSKQHTGSVPPSDTPDQTISSSNGKDEEESEKVLKLIRDLQEIATTQSKTASPAKAAAVVDNEERELDQMLTDLGVFEAYVTKLLDEQQSEVDLQTRGEMPMIDIGSLETITEEETSKECSPSCGGSPAPQYSPHQTIGCRHDNNSSQSNAEVHSESQVSLEEFQLLLKQISDTVRQDEVFEDTRQPPSTNKDQTPGGQFMETEKEFQSVIDSLETQHKFIETQHELQEMMDSLNPSTVITSLSSPSGSTDSPQSVPEQQQLLQQTYDSLNTAQDPLYSFPKKDRKGSIPKPPVPPLDLTEPPAAAGDEEDQIYDSLLDFTTESLVVDTPPPLPLKRTPSDGGVSSSSNDSPKNERRRSISSDDGECNHHRDSHAHHHRHSSHHHRSSRRHGSRRHSSSSSSSRKSDCHCCYHDDESPDGCGHHHRPRSRERHHHHHGHHHHHHRHRSRSDSDQEVECRSTRRRRVGESSGYESQEFESSPSFSRKVSRSHSDATTPREGRKGFLSGLFSRKSTTSLNSISSRMSEVGEDVSVSSYRM